MPKVKHEPTSTRGKSKPYVIPARQSSRIRKKAIDAKKYKIRPSNLIIELDVIGEAKCSRDLIHGEELSLSGVCGYVTNYFEGISDVVVTLENTGTVVYRLNDINFYNRHGQIPNVGTLSIGRSIYRPQHQPECIITLRRTARR